jgi:hypothetical protein|nr:MAG TPA: hypothetical protein [Caudoviricetes sp.]
MNISDLRAAVAKEEDKARRKMARIKAGTYNPLGKRSVLSEIVPEPDRVKQSKHFKKGSRLPHYGVDISGTKYDPMRNSKYMNGKTLKNYLERLKGFNTPTVGYFKGMNGTIITAQAMRTLIRANRANNKRKADIVEANSDVYVPWLNRTVGEYDEQVRKKSYPSDAGGWDLKQYNTPTPAIVTPKGAQEMIDKISQVSGPHALTTLSEANQKSLNGMLPYLSDTARTTINNVDARKLAFAVQHDDAFFDRLHELYVIMGSGDDSPTSAMIANEAEESFLTYLEDVNSLELK